MWGSPRSEEQRTNEKKKVTLHRSDRLPSRSRPTHLRLPSVRRRPPSDPGPLLDSLLPPPLTHQLLNSFRATSYRRLRLTLRYPSV